MNRNEQTIQMEIAADCPQNRQLLIANCVFTNHWDFVDPTFSEGIKPLIRIAKAVPWISIDERLVYVCVLGSDTAVTGSCAHHIVMSS